MVKSKLTTSEIIRLYDAGHPVSEISEMAEISKGGVWKRMRTIKHPTRGNKGSTWAKNQGEDEFLGSDGRWWVRHYYNNKGRSSERRYIVVMERYLGYPIPKGMVVHHIDEDPTNDDIGNLALMTKAAHNRLHLRERGVY